MKLNFLFFSTLLLIYFNVSAQSEEQKAMAKLSYLVGDWAGEGKSFSEEGTTANQVREKVRYDLNGEILVLKVRNTRDGETVLSLHTIIYYSVADQCYYYNAYTRRGTRPFKGQFEDGKFVCYFNDDYRLTFRKTKEGAFNEFGERLIEGKWVKNFEDILWPTEELDL